MNIDKTKSCHHEGHEDHEEVDVKTARHFATKDTKEHEEENTKNDFDFDTDSECEERVCVLPTPE